jgi:hypothetical protein
VSPEHAVEAYDRRGADHQNGDAHAGSRFKDRAMLRAHRRALGVPEDDGALRRALGLADGETIPRNHCVEPFTFHDLRRSMRTRLSALAIPHEVRELMIAHRPSGLHQTCDLHRRVGGRACRASCPRQADG